MPAPSTGGARGAAPVAGPAGGGAKGAPLTFERGRTSKRALQLQWDFPVFVPPEAARKPDAQAHTVTTPVEAALPKEEAMSWILKEDKRPLLVLRECNKCKGSDDALLSRTLKNEETMMLARYFHCVKLPVHVLQAKHPFHELFATEHPPHVFFATSDGANVLEMRGQYVQSELWKAMRTTLDREYVRDVDSSIKEMLKLMSQYDVVDSRQDELRDRREKEVEKYGPKSEKLAPLDRELAELEKQREKLRLKEKAILDLGPRHAESGKPGEKKDAKAGG
jgi:hypothetical protein